MNCFVDYVWSPFVSCHLCLGMGLRMGRTLTHIEMEINPVDFGWLLKEHASLLHPCFWNHNASKVCVGAQLSHELYL